MSEPPRKGLLDHAIEWLASAMDTLGLGGRRLRWRWSQRRLRLDEAGMQISSLLRPARARHRMCPGCHALVPRRARRCPQCGTGLGLALPGAGLLPRGATATSLLLLANGALFLLMLMTSIRNEEGLALLGAFSGAIFAKYGAVSAAAAFGFGEWWRLLTALFLHGGLLHFAFNSYALLGLGPLVEGEYGAERFWVVYLASGFLGNLAHVLLSPAPVVGASGAICGLVGVLIAYGSRVGTAGGRSVKAEMLRFAVLIGVISLMPGVSWQAHLGGLVGGLGLGWLVPTGEFRSRAAGALWQGLSLAGVILVLFCFYSLGATR